MDRYTKGFVLASLVYFFLAAVLGVLMGAAEGPGGIRFAHVHFNLLGFMAMMIYGVGYFILPRFNGRTLRWPKLVPVHFYAANIGLIGMVAADRPSAAFTAFALLSVASVALFVVNLGATLALAPPAEAEEEPAEAPAGAPAASAARSAKAEADGIHPDVRVGEILSRWPGAADVLVAHGFSSLADPGHREQVKQIPITLRMACQRHNVDVDYLVAQLREAVAGGAPAPAGAPAGRAAGKRPRLVRGNPVGADDILGDIIATYPATEKVFRKYYGDGCFSCPGQATESVKQSALMHNVSEKQLLAELNRAAGF